MKTILAIGAHYDDIEIGVAGVLHKHVQRGDIIYMFVMCSDEYRTGDPIIRLKEQYCALDELGIQKDNLLTSVSDCPDTEIITTLDKIAPNVIYAPYENDTHQDHRRCSLIGQSVGRKRNITTMFYAGASAHGFIPTVFVNIDFKKKQSILNCYSTQIECGAINVLRIKHRERYWGTMISDEIDCHAEGFVIHKMELKI